MGIQIDGTTVIDNFRRGEFNVTNPGTFTTTERDALSPSEGDMIFNTTEDRLEIWNGTEWAAAADTSLEVDTFSPPNGETAVNLDVNISLTFNTYISKGTGNIFIREGSATGTLLETIDASGSQVSINSRRVAVINPATNFPVFTNIYVVVEAGCFETGRAVVNDRIDTYNFTTRTVQLGDPYEGGNLIRCTGGNYWIVSPVAADVGTSWYGRNNMVNAAQNLSPCGDWFVPDISTLQAAMGNNIQYWGGYCNGIHYWSNTQQNAQHAWAHQAPGGPTNRCGMPDNKRGRALRQISY